MFGKKLREANKKIESQREILSQQESIIRTGQERNDELSEGIIKFTKEKDELKAQVRDQTEADLLFVSMKIIDEIKKGTTKKDPNLVSLHHEQGRLRELRAQSGSFAGSSRGLQAMGAYGGLL